MSKNRRAQTV